MNLTLTITDSERRLLKRSLLHFVECIAKRKTAGRVVEKGPLYGHVVENGTDVTAELYREEQRAREVLRRLP